MAEKKLVQKVSKNGNQWVYSVVGGVKDDKPAPTAKAAAKEKAASSKAAPKEKAVAAE